MGDLILLLIVVAFTLFVFAVGDMVRDYSKILEDENRRDREGGSGEGV